MKSQNEYPKYPVHYLTEEVIDAMQDIIFNLVLITKPEASSLKCFLKRNNLVLSMSELKDIRINTSNQVPELYTLQKIHNYFSEFKKAYIVETPKQKVLIFEGWECSFENDYIKEIVYRTTLNTVYRRIQTVYKDGKIMHLGNALFNIKDNTEIVNSECSYFGYYTNTNTNASKGIEVYTNHGIRNVKVQRTTIKENKSINDSEFYVYKNSDIKYTKYNYNECGDPIPSQNSSLRGSVYWEYTPTTKSLVLKNEDETTILRRYTYCPKGNVIEYCTDSNSYYYYYEYKFQEGRLVQIIRKFLLRQDTGYPGDVIFHIPK